MATKCANCKGDGFLILQHVKGGQMAARKCQACKAFKSHAQATQAAFMQLRKFKFDLATGHLIYPNGT